MELCSDVFPPSFYVEVDTFFNEAHLVMGPIGIEELPRS
jgi:hypothetical protein